MIDHEKHSKKEELKKVSEKNQENPLKDNEEKEHGGVPPQEKGAQNAAPADLGTLREKLAAMEAENADYKDRFVRKYAEFENYKKRAVREREEAAKYSNSLLLLDITTIIDDFERALKSAEESKDFGKLHSGISLIEKRLVSILEKKWGLERFYAKGAVFDPERHEALMAEQSKEVSQPLVGEDLQSGYLLFGKVLRPAKVKVIQPLIGNSQPVEGVQNNSPKEN